MRRQYLRIQAQFFIFLMYWICMHKICSHTNLLAHRNKFYKNYVPIILKIEIKLAMTRVELQRLPQFTFATYNISYYKSV